MIRVDSQQPFHTKTGDFIRTGVVGDGSCFFHSVLYSCTPEYRKLTIPERMCLVEDLRRLISKEVTVDIWLSLGNGEVAKLAYQTHLARILDKYDLGTYIKNDYIPRLLQKYGYIDATCNIDDSRLEKMISSEYNRFKTTLLHKSREAIEYAYSEFIKNVESTDYFVDVNLIEFIGDVIGYDIYFIDYKSQAPYKLGGDSSIKNRESIILLHINNTHYESLGVERENQIIYTFSHTDNLIRKIRKNTI